MSAKRYVIAAGFAMLCAGWAQAATVPPPSPYFDVSLDGWSSDELFDVTANSTFSPSEENGFSQNELCPSGDWEKCICHDPGARLTTGGDPIPFNANVGATITTNDEGDADVDYVNVGPNLETVLFTTTITNPDKLYTCSSNVFGFCGFEISGPAGAETLNILFTDPLNPGGIPTATPEPAQSALMLIALGGMVVVQRIRSRRA
jgi:hypothetical protein